MSRERREPEAIRRKKKRRRSPEEIEELRRRRRNDELRQLEEYGEVQIKKRRPIDEKGGERSPRNKKRKRKMANSKKVMIGIGGVLALILILGVVAVATFLGKIRNDGVMEATVPAPDQPVNILILGFDVGDPEQVENYDIKRTDTIMVAQYDPKEKDLDLVSIPRDTLIKENGKNYKINAAYQKGGDEKIKKLVENMLAIEVNYIFKIDYNAFRQFIDAIGGIEMEIERDMYYDDITQDLHIRFTKGTVEHLDGKKAEEFFRWRKNNDGTGLVNGDIDRIENQHKLIQKVVEKCTSPSIVLKVPSIIDAVASNIQTNMPSSKILSYALDVVKIDTSTFKMWTAEGDFKDIAGQSYVVFNKDYNQELLDALHKSGDKSVDKSKVGVMVLNGTKINGLAGEVKTQLELAGWKVVDVGNADTTSKSVIKTNDNNIKKEINNALPKIKKSDKKPEDTKYEQYDVVIVLGEDYKKLGE